MKMSVFTGSLPITLPTSFKAFFHLKRTLSPHVHRKAVTTSIELFWSAHLPSLPPSIKDLKCTFVKLTSKERDLICPWQIFGERIEGKCLHHC